jgi:hypothetical protein
MAMLDSINKFSVDNNHDITVFLCKIINRFISEDQEPTTQFNIEVEDTVATRSGDKINIIMVDMENGAGLDYTDSLPDPTANPPYEGGDMWGTRYPKTSLDKFHPNIKGNYKMALKYYEELVKELPEPDSIKNNKVEGIEITPRSDSSLLITWAANFLDEDGYIVERAEIGGDFTIVDTANANTRYLIDSVALGTNSYTYRVKAFNTSGESLDSEEITYTPSYYDLTMLIEGQGTVEPGNSEYLAGADIVVTLTAVPAEGWEFDNWTGDISSYRYSNPTSITMDSDKSITCNFQEITTQVSGHASSDCRIYPNPVNNKLTIELQDNCIHNNEIRLFDNVGRLILNEKFQGFKHTLDLGNLFPGTYLVKVTVNNEEIINKQIVRL